MYYLEHSNVTLVPGEIIVRISGENCKYDNTVIAVIDFEDLSSISYVAFDYHGITSDRNKITIEYLNNLIINYAKPWLAGRRGRYAELIFQGDDRPSDAKSLSWQSKKHYSNVCLLPDFYYVFADGYKKFLDQPRVVWQEKEKKVFWRGSTTGGWDTTSETLQLIPRYQLCCAGKTLGDKVDFGISGLVQMKNDEEKARVRSALESEGLLKESIPLEEYSRYKFFIQIDGNGNSWELIKKLRLGSCMILVDSDWILWHNQQIRPWQHYIPVRRDLSDLQAVIDWCLTHDAEAEGVARRGRDFAMSIDYDAEMQSAAMLALDHSCNLT